MYNPAEIPLYAALCLSVYIFCIVLIILSLQRMKKSASRKQKESCSIIIPFRNEEKNLSKLLESLLIQDYDLNNCQFIFVNDRSSDTSESILKAYLNKFQDAELIVIRALPAGKFGKKHALEKGIEKAKHDILLFTDADCVCDTNWISSTLDCFSETTACLIGKAPLTKTNFFSGAFQEAENFFNHIILLFSLAIGKASMAFGRNFAYRKSSFEVIGAFSKIDASLSGDDDLLVQEFQKAKRNILFNPSSAVYSSSVDSFPELSQQKTRHFHALKFMPLKEQLIAFLIHSFHFALYLILLSEGLYFLLFYKFIADFSLFYFANMQLTFKSLFRNLVYWELFYWLFVPYFGIRSYLTKQDTINWKQ